MLMLMLVQVETKGREGERARSIVEYDDDDNEVDDIADDNDDNDDDNVGVGPREGERGARSSVEYTRSNLLHCTCRLCNKRICQKILTL